MQIEKTRNINGKKTFETNYGEIIQTKEQKGHYE